MTTITWTLTSPPPVVPAATLVDPYHGATYYGASNYGGLLGHATTLRGRLLQFIRLGPNAAGLVAAFADRVQEYVNTSELIRDAFDLDTADGDRLDKIGSIVQRPRNGLADADYLIAIEIQIQLILSSTASADTILEIVRLFTGVEAPEYSEHYPMGFTVGADVASLDEGVRLLDLICQARAGAYHYRLVSSVVCSGTDSNLPPVSLDRTG